MADSEAKARKKLDEADKKARGGGGGFFGKVFGGGGSDEAADLYIQAGNLFKMAKLWKEAGDAFVRAAEIRARDADSRHDVASQYSEAGNCYRKTNPQFAVECLMKTAEIYTDMGRFNMAAKVHTTIAELYETDCPDKQQCITHYQKAADYYKGEESKSSATKCLEKVGMMAAEIGQYQKAVQIFEEIAMYQSEHATLKYGAKTTFFRALLCQLNIDLLNTEHALARYEEASPAFTDSRECKLVKDLLAALQAENEEDFTKVLTNFDKISKLDTWQTALLVKVKRTISKKGNDNEDEDDMK